MIIKFFKKYNYFRNKLTYSIIFEKKYYSFDLTENMSDFFISIFSERFDPEYE